MRTISFRFLFLFLLFLLHHSQSSEFPPNTTGYTCPINQTSSPPCQTYAFYRATSPDYLSLSSISDLFSISRLMISIPSNISPPNSTLIPSQPLFIPLTCSCNSVNSSLSLSFSNLTYIINPGDTYWLVSTNHFQNLTTYQSVILVNPTLDPTNLDIGVTVYFPIFCKCPNQTQLRNNINYLISYVFQPGDNLSLISSQFNTTAQAIIDVNGNNINQFDTIFIPVTRLHTLPQLNNNNNNSNNTNTNNTTSVSNSDSHSSTVNVGLEVGMAIILFLLILVMALWGYREILWRRRDEVKLGGRKKKNGKGVKEMEVSLMADVSDCLDKYRVFRIEELRDATGGFDHRSLIEGSVYKGFFDKEVYAIKRMKWNASDELRILQKVNHGNLVKLEGFCIDPEDGNCYLIYEYVKNGSLHSWLHDNTKPEKLSWKTRLRIAIDIANGLQYIHEHTRPKVVHKDIKTSNILLDPTMRAKIANFGLAKSGCNAITMHIVGTQGYIAPEYLQDGVVSTKMDVFSFGVVLLELVSGREAIDGDGKVLWAKAVGILEGGKEEEKVKKVRGWMDEVMIAETYSMDSVINVMALAIACLHKDPSKRPSMVDIVYALCKSDELFFDVSEDGFSPLQVIAR